MCDKTEIVNVKILADLSCTGKEKWKNAKIDKCIAPIVKALQVAEIDMRGSCCGHGRTDGEIPLQDGRTIIIKNMEVIMGCKKCDDLMELFENLVKTGKSTNRDYWLMTELFVMLHEGKDYCNIN